MFVFQLSDSASFVIFKLDSCVSCVNFSVEFIVMLFCCFHGDMLSLFNSLNLKAPFQRLVLLIIAYPFCGLFPVKGFDA
jgi:hypothetical protein